MPDQVFTAGQVLTAAQMTDLQSNIGLTFIKSQTIGSAVSTVEVTDAFSSSFDNYLVTVSGGVASTASIMRIQLGATTSGYYYSLVFTVWGNVVSSEGATNNALLTSVGINTTTGLQMYCDIFSPNLPTRTLMRAPRVSTSDVGNTFGLLDNTTQYTSFTISPSSGTMTGGVIRVYGYRK
jgi:hypothetical protein